MIVEIRTFGDLIDWTRQLHEHLAHCLSHCANYNEEECAGMLFYYLADYQIEMEYVVCKPENRADPKALNTYVYDYLYHKPNRSHRTFDAPYAALDFNEICREIFDFHDQVTDLYRNLIGKAEIPEARELLESLLEIE
ncbi:MAG: ATPase [Halomonas sp.]|uniref:ATPase n=1 Tax=Halomonas sp. TaxID=1486246 RepID=UPI002ACE1014|nr:ATPase [Halomonas sp.]MDZ7851566.1 ATPase [Halomonas sp.]